MPFRFHTTTISGLTLIEPHLFLDERGSYKKYYEKAIFKENGISGEFTESSEIISHKGVLRGLHYQIKHSQAKLLHVVAGEIFDVALDLRLGSAAFGKWEAFYLGNDGDKMLYIPAGFAHGFLVLANNTVFSYQSSGKYDPASSDGIVWNDPTLHINWPLSRVEDVIVSEKDKKLQTFLEFTSKLGLP
jgi:dTDP-4-dehydrorhamnose 3,5-epimerase